MSSTEYQNSSTRKHFWCILTWVFSESNANSKVFNKSYRHPGWKRLSWKESLSAQLQRQLLHFLNFPFCLLSPKCFWFYHLFLSSDSVCSAHGNSLVLIQISGILLWNIIYHGSDYHFSYLGHRCTGLYLETSFFSELSNNLWKEIGQQKSTHLQQTRIHSLWNFKNIQLFFCPCHPIFVGNVIWLYLVQ